AAGEARKTPGGAMNLGLAVFWVLVGIGLLVWHALDPEATRGKLGGVSLGWVALVLGAYLFARWWSDRSYRAMRQMEREARERRHRRPREAEEPDPDSPFRFDDPPSAPETPGRPQ